MLSPSTASSSSISGSHDPAEILARATLETARHPAAINAGLHRERQCGRLLPGSGRPYPRAQGDKTIRMVVKDGIVYFPTRFTQARIKPFTTAPTTQRRPR